MSIDALSVGSDGSDDSYIKESLQSLVCPKCSVKYPNLHELLTHQRAEQHFVCDKCEQCYWTEDDLRKHKRNYHRPELDLECFGCGSHFDRAHLLWNHFESNECKVIYPSDIARLREKNLEFAQQLELRKATLEDIIQQGESHIKGEHTWASDFGGEIPEPAMPPTSPPPAAFALTRNAHPLHYRSEDFPVLPTQAKTPKAFNPLGYRSGNSWSNRKATISQTPNKAPVSYNAVPPPTSYDSPPAYASRNAPHSPAHNNRIQTTEAPTNPVESSGPQSTTTLVQRIVDPDHPDYNPAVFHNSLLEKYVCPYKSCGKKFNNVYALTQHLRSPAHAGGRISCICCKKQFTTVASLISHMETATKCPIRDTDGFRRALGQVTGGILDFHIRSGMFTIDQNSVRRLLEMRSEASPPKKSDVHVKMS
ncbi:hypothetical protein F5Y10DRAFT_287437 [Nemania abortiva]|nr:hypothetical protein F5Y10DRAFT_287437 [Nemania abortiva]